MIEHSSNIDVDVLVGSDICLRSDLIQEIAWIYICVFGNTEGVNEGAVNKVGHTISLSEYLSPFIKKEPNQLSTLEVLKMMKSLKELPKSKYKQLIEGLSEVNGGYYPYYSYNDVVNRFFRDLSKKNGGIPIATYWGDEKYEVCGFLTGVVIEDTMRFSDIIDGTPYFNTDHRCQIKKILVNSGLETPFLFEHEGAIVDDRKGRQNGSRWPNLLYNLRKTGIRFGATKSVGITFSESNYHRGHESFLNDYLIEDNLHPMRFVIHDLQKSVEGLRNTIDN